MRKRNRSKLIFSKGVFINPVGFGGHAAVSAHFTEDRSEYKKGDVNYSLDGRVSMNDCNRIIEWNFDIYNDDDPLALSRMKEKLKNVRDFFNELYDAVKDYELPPDEDLEDEE